MISRRFLDNRRGSPRDERYNPSVLRGKNEISLSYSWYETSLEQTCRVRDEACSDNLWAALYKNEVWAFSLWQYVTVFQAEADVILRAQSRWLSSSWRPDLSFKFLSTLVCIVWLVCSVSSQSRTELMHRRIYLLEGGQTILHLGVVGNAINAFNTFAFLRPELVLVEITYKSF